MIRILQQMRFLALLNIFQVFFENPLNFLEKDPHSERFKKSYHFSRILRQFCYNLFEKTLSSVTWTYWRCWRVGVNPIGKHRLKNVRNAHLRWRFCYHILKTMAQNINDFTLVPRSNSSIAPKIISLFPLVLQYNWKVISVIEIHWA